MFLKFVQIPSKIQDKNPEQVAATKSRQNPSYLRKAISLFQLNLVKGNLLAIPQAFSERNSKKTKNSKGRI